MYNIGETVVYPMHGAGTIVKIEKKEILGEVRSYYHLKIPYDNMKIMIPVDTSDLIGVRPVIAAEKITDVIDVLKAEATEMDSNWNRRYRDNMEELKTGDIMKVAAVVRNLMHVENDKKLSSGEKKMLSNAKQILASEFLLSKGINLTEAEELIEKSVFNYI